MFRNKYLYLHHKNLNGYQYHYTENSCLFLKPNTQYPLLHWIEASSPSFTLGRNCFAQGALPGKG